MARTKTKSDEDVLAIAREVFLAQGHAASTRTIAKEAGLSEAVLYQRFGSKDALFFEAMTAEIADLPDLDLFDTSDAKAFLTQVGDSLVDYFIEILPVFLHVATHPSLDGSRLADWHRQLPFPSLIEDLAEKLTELSAAGRLGTSPAEPAAQSFVASMLSTALLATLTSHDKGSNQRDQIAKLIDVLWRGIAPTSKDTKR